MSDKLITKTIINDLESKELSIVETAVVLASQGYFVNKAKQVRLYLSSILLHAFENIDVFSNEQQKKIEIIYNKFSTI